MTPEELARAGMNPGAYYGEQAATSYDAIRKKVLAGELPAEMLSGRGATTIRPPGSSAAGDVTGDLFQDIMNRFTGIKDKALEPGGPLKNKDNAYRRAGGGKTGGLVGAAETFMSDPIAGVISAPVGVIAGQGANMLTNRLTEKMILQGPPVAKAAGMALRYLAPGLVGYGAQQATAGGVQALTGTANQMAAGATSAASGGLFGMGSGMQDLSINVPILGKVNIGERAKRRSEDEYQLERQGRAQSLEFERMRKQSEFNRINELAFLKAQGEINNTNSINQMKAMAPILADAQRREATANQALMNSQIANMQSLGRMSGAFQLAGQGIAETGALARTLAANSPYRSAMLPMPQIQFGA